MSDPYSSNTTEIQKPKHLSAKILLDDIEQNRAQWLELRKGKITSSNVAVVCGLSPFKSPLQLWAEWTGKIQDTFIGNKATQIGLALEPLVASWWSERSGLGVDRANALYADSELPWLACSPDYIIEGGDPLEIKTGNYRTAYKWADGAAPQEYILQVQVQLRVLKRQRGVLTAYLGDLDSMPDVLVDYDPQLFELVRERSEAFLDCVQKDIPPAAGSGDAEVIRLITDREEGKTATWSGAEAEAVEFLIIQAREAAETCAAIRRELDKVDKQKRELENRIKQALGSATVGRLPTGDTVRLTTVHVGERMVQAYSYDRLTLPKAA